jgi:hypothetical protein
MFATYTTRFNNKNYTFCPHSVFMYSLWISKQTAIISLYSINWLVSINEKECVYCAVRTVFMCFVWISEQTAIISLYSINWLVSINETECVYCAVRTVFMCFVWISEQTAIISLYSINWLVCVTETECVYCAVRTESLNKTLRFVLMGLVTRTVVVQYRIYFKKHLFSSSAHLSYFFIYLCSLWFLLYILYILFLRLASLFSSLSISFYPSFTFLPD